MNRYKIAKINFNDMIKPCAVFYAILCAVLLCTIVTVKVMPGLEGNMGGVDMVTIVFILICGLCSFKENFNFAKANSVSRKSVAEGLLLSCIPIALILSIADLVLNRIVNLFIPMPNMYEMCYGKISGPVSLTKATANWIPDNSFLGVINTIVLQFLLLLSAFIVGLVFASILYRCSKRMKAFVWIAGCIVLNIIFNVQWIAEGAKFIFGLSSKSVYLGMISLLVLTVICSVSLIAISRKAQVK